MVAADLNGDGRIDLYVANDMNPNFLFLNKGDGTFEDATETSGAAFDERGQAQSSMGVDAEDCDGDGRPELFVTNFQNEHIAYYQNLSGSAPVRTGGAAAGRLPRVVGRSRPGRRQQAVGRLGLCPGRLRQRRLARQFRRQRPRRRQSQGPRSDHELPRAAALVPQRAGRRPGVNDRARRRFQLSTRDAGPYFATRHVARGAAFGDLDDDGDIDIVVNHMDGAPADPPQRYAVRQRLDSLEAGRHAEQSRRDRRASSKSTRAAGPSLASERGAAACNRRTTRGC